MKHSGIYILVVFVFSVNIGIAQVSINNIGENADSSAMLDVSSNNSGMLIPRMSSDQRSLISNPPAGLMVFDNGTNSFWFYNGTGWKELKTATQNNGSSIEDADGDTRIETEHTPNENRIHFKVNGNEALVLRTNNNGNAMLDFSSDNTLIGTNTASSLSTGTGNTFFGSNTGSASTAGSGNTFLGANTGTNIVDGNANVLAGRQAGSADTIGSHNVMLGYQAGQYSKDSNNVYLGYQAGRNSAGGSGNVFLGNSAGYNSTGSNLLKIRLGNTDVIDGDFANPTLDFLKPVHLGNINTNGYLIKRNGKGLFIDGSGNVGVNTTSPTARLDINGNASLRNASQDNFDITFSSDLLLASTYQGQQTKYLVFRINSDGTLNTSFTSSNLVTTSKLTTGTYEILFQSGAFTTTPIVVAVSGGNQRMVLNTVNQYGATINSRNSNGDLTDATFYVHVFGR